MKTWSLTKTTWSFTFNNIFQFVHPIYKNLYILCTKKKKKKKKKKNSKANTCFSRRRKIDKILSTLVKLKQPKFINECFLSHMKAIQINTDARDCSIKICWCFKGNDVMS